MRIATLGDNCIDRYLPPVGQAFVGGNAVNVAVQLRRLGHDVHYFGAVGDDAAGAAVRDCLAAQGLDLSGLRCMNGEVTAYTDIATAADGERSFLFEEFGATGHYRPDTTDMARLRGMDHVHIGWLTDGGAAKLLLSAAGVSVSQDLSVNNAPDNLSPAGLAIVFASAAEDEAEERLRGLLGGGARLAVVTLGAAGSIASDGRTSARAAALAVEPVDTTGAGDSFIAGFLSAHLGGGSLMRSLLAGAARGRLACLHHGGFPQSPRPIG